MEKAEQIPLPQDEGSIEVEEESEISDELGEECSSAGEELRKTSIRARVQRLHSRSLEEKHEDEKLDSEDSGDEDPVEVELISWPFARLRGFFHGILAILKFLVNPLKIIPTVFFLKTILWMFIEPRMCNFQGSSLLPFCIMAPPESSGHADIPLFGFQTNLGNLQKWNAEDAQTPILLQDVEPFLKGIAYLFEEAGIADLNEMFNAVASEASKSADKLGDMHFKSGSAFEHMMNQTQQIRRQLANIRRREASPLRIFYSFSEGVDPYFPSAKEEILELREQFNKILVAEMQEILTTTLGTSQKFADLQVGFGIIQGIATGKPLTHPDQIVTTTKEWEQVMASYAKQIPDLKMKIGIMPTLMKYTLSGTKSAQRASQVINRILADITLREGKLPEVSLAEFFEAVDECLGNFKKDNALAAKIKESRTTGLNRKYWAGFGF